jgi:acyl carrier protein
MKALDSAKRLLAETANCEPDAIPDDVRVGAYDRWDSLAHMRLLLEIEARLGRALDPEEIVRIETLADIAALLQR